MALYIEDKSIVNLLHTDIGIELIVNWIEEVDGIAPSVEKKQDGEVTMILTNCWVGRDGMIMRHEKSRSNTVTIYYNSIMVNPFFNHNQKNITQDLYRYILKLPNIIRNINIEKILNEI